MKSRSEAHEAGALVWGKIGAKAAEAIVPILIVRILGPAEVGELAGLLLAETSTRGPARPKPKRRQPVARLPADAARRAADP